MAKDRAKDDRRSVGSHNKMTAALGRAAGWETHGDHEVAFKSDNSKYFAPGHGHVTVGKMGYYEPENLTSIESVPFGATKGLSNVAHGRPEKKLPKKGKGKPSGDVEDAETK